MKRFNILLALLVFGSALLSQGVAVNETGSAPAAKALLDISSTTKGMLMPRMTKTQRLAITSPPAGLLVFELDHQTMYLHDGNQWRPLMFTSERKLPLVELASSDPQGGYGYSVAIHGNTAVVGAPLAVVNGAAKGAAYVYIKENGAWKFQSKLIASNGNADEGFAESVDVYQDMIVIGANRKTISGLLKAGAIYIYKRSGVVWTEDTILTASLPDANAQFGYSVAVNSGNVITGAPWMDLPGVPTAGSVYVFKEISGQWSQRAQLGASDAIPGLKLGYSVDINGTELVAGSPGADVNLIKSGAVYTYFFNGSFWSQGAKLLPDAPQANMSLGTSVAITTGKIISGAPKWSMSLPGETLYDVGRVYKWFKNGLAQWVGQNAETGSRGGELFGQSVSIDGNYYVIGIPGYGSGKALVETWSSDDKYEVTDIDGKFGYFGNSVSISGDQYVIGAPYKNSFKGSVQFGMKE